MYVRFVIQQKDEDSGRRQGVFQALADLADAGSLLPHERAVWGETYEWFVKNLREPLQFSRSLKPHAKKVALSWFKDSAGEHISRMFELVEILKAHGVAVEVLRTERPGYIVDEDAHQVVAEPFNETPT